MPDTLTEALAARGLAHRSTGGSAGKREVLRNGAVVFAGAAHEVWVWLRERDAAEGRCGACGLPKPREDDERRRTILLAIGFGRNPGPDCERLVERKLGRCWSPDAEACGRGREGDAT